MPKKSWHQNFKINSNYYLYFFSIQYLPNKINNQKCYICITYSKIWVLNWFFWWNDGKFDWIEYPLVFSSNKRKTRLHSGVEIFFTFHFVQHNMQPQLCSLSGKWNMAILKIYFRLLQTKLSPGETFSSTGWNSHWRNHLLTMNAEKHSQRKDLRKNYENLLKFSQQWENIQKLKSIHCRITFLNNIFGHLELFSGLITQNLISHWNTDMLIHLPFRFHLSSFFSSFNFLFRGGDWSCCMQMIWFWWQKQRSCWWKSCVNGRRVWNWRVLEWTL